MTPKRALLVALVSAALLTTIALGLPRLFTTVSPERPATPTAAEAMMRASLEAKIGPVFIRRHPWGLALSPLVIECDLDAGLQRDEPPAFWCDIWRDGDQTGGVVTAAWSPKGPS